MKKLAYPIGESMLLKAHRAIAEKQNPDAAQLVAEFYQHFVVLERVKTHPTFERFSLADSAIRPVVQSNTTGF